MTNSLVDRSCFPRFWTYDPEGTPLRHYSPSFSLSLKILRLTYGSQSKTEDLNSMPTFVPRAKFQLARSAIINGPVIAVQRRKTALVLRLERSSTSSCRCGVRSRNADRSFDKVRKPNNWRDRLNPYFDNNQWKYETIFFSITVTRKTQITIKQKTATSRTQNTDNDDATPHRHR